MEHQYNDGDRKAAKLEEIQDEIMPKIKAIYSRLHSGSDEMRDEGHKLWLLYNKLETILKA